MTTRKLVEWCHEAKKIHEESFHQEENRPGNYNVTIMEALQQSKPRDTHDYELEMAHTLIGLAWNETGEWYKKVEERKLRNKVTK